MGERRLGVRVSAVVAGVVVKGGGAGCQAGSGICRGPVTPSPSSGKPPPTTSSPRSAAAEPPSPAGPIRRRTTSTDRHDDPGRAGPRAAQGRRVRPTSASSEAPAQIVQLPAPLSRTRGRLGTTKKADRRPAARSRRRRTRRCRATVPDSRTEIVMLRRPTEVPGWSCRASSGLTTSRDRPPLWPTSWGCATYGLGMAHMLGYACDLQR